MGPCWVAFGQSFSGPYFSELQIFERLIDADHMLPNVESNKESLNCLSKNVKTIRHYFHLDHTNND